MIEILEPPVVEALRTKYGPGVEIVSWGDIVERQWSWQTTISLTGAPHPKLVIKVPRWEEVPTLREAIAAGQQESTVAEFETLRSIGAAVAANRDPGLTAVEAIAYLPSINGIVMSHLDGRPVRSALRTATRRRRADILARIGRLVGLLHRSQSHRREEADAATIADEVSGLLTRAEACRVARLVELLRRLAVSNAWVGMSEPVGFVHGDLNATNLLVDRSDRVAVIDPNLVGEGPQLSDVAHLLSELLDDRVSLLTAGMVGRRTAQWADAVIEAYGAGDEPMLPIREALQVAQRWVSLEEDLTGFSRLALVPARLALRRRLRDAVAASTSRTV